jgi:hypothetical protein
MKLLAKISYICWFFVLNSLSHAQVRVGEFMLSADFSVKKNTELLALNDSGDSSRIAFFAFDREKISACELDEKFHLITNHNYTNPNFISFTNLLGGIYSNKKSILVYANGRRKSFNVISVNNERKFLVNKEIKVPKDEIFLESFQFGENYYLVTTGWTSSYLAFYRIDTELNIETRKIELENFSFGNYENGLYQNLLNGEGELSISKISYETKNSLATAVGQHKIYVFDNTFSLTLDKFFGQTLLLRIDLQNWITSLNKIDLKNTNCKKSNSTSFLFYNHLFKSQVCDDQLLISVFNSSTGSELIRFQVDSESEIEFKNTPIMQEGGNTIYAADSRELTSTKSLLRKMIKSDMSISVNLSELEENYYEVTIGSFEEKQMASGGVPNYSGVPTAAIGGMNLQIPYNPTYSGYLKNTWTKSVFFKTKIKQENFSHLQGKIEKNEFDRIKDFTNRYSNKIVTETVFYRNAQYYLFHYNNDSQNLVITKF